MIRTIEYTDQLIEAAFKDDICHAKDIQYNFLSDYDKDFIRSTIKYIKTS